MNMAKEERERIVSFVDGLFADGKQPLVSRHHREAARWIRNAVERGEHWRVTK